MNPKQAKLLIGKRIAWDDHRDPRRGTYLVRTGILDSVNGRNVVINDEYYWLPSLVNFREATKDDVKRK